MTTVKLEARAQLRPAAVQSKDRSGVFAGGRAAKPSARALAAHLAEALRDV